MILCALPLTGRGFAQRGIYDSNVSHKTQFSKQLDDFLKLQTPRCEKPLLASGRIFYEVYVIWEEAFTSFFSIDSDWNLTDSFMI